MYPTIEFKGKVIAKKLVDNCVQGENGCIELFSGGVDAFNTLVQHISEKTTLLTLWGSDVGLSDIEGWKKVEKHLDSTAKQFGLDRVWVKTEFKKFIEEGLLSAAVKKAVMDGGTDFITESVLSVTLLQSPISWGRILFI